MVTTSKQCAIDRRDHCSAKHCIWTAGTVFRWYILLEEASKDRLPTLLPVRRLAACWPAQPQLASFHLFSKVLQVLAQLTLRVVDSVGHNLPNLATRWVTVGHRHLYTCTTWGNLLKAYSPRVLDLTLDAFPRDAACRTHLSGLGLVLDGLA